MLSVLYVGMPHNTYSESSRKKVSGTLAVFLEMVSYAKSDYMKS